MVLSCEVFSQAPSVTLSRTLPASGSLVACSDASYRVTITNNASSNLTFTSLVISTSSSITSPAVYPVPTVIAGSSGFSITGSSGVYTTTAATPPVITPHSSITVDFSEHFGSSFIDDHPLTGGYTYVPINLTNTAQFNGVITGGGSTSASSTTITDVLDYGNLFLDVSSSVLSGSSHIGGTVTRELKLVPSGSSAIDFAGVIHFSDAPESGSCHMLDIKQVDIQVCNVFTGAFIRTVSSTALTGGIHLSTSITTPSFTLHRATEVLKIKETVQVIADPSLTIPLCIHGCTHGQIASMLNITWGCDAGDMIKQIPLAGSSPSYLEALVSEDSKMPLVGCFSTINRAPPAWDGGCLLSNSPSDTTYISTQTMRIVNVGESNANHITFRLSTGNDRSAELIMPWWVTARYHDGNLPSTDPGTDLMVSPIDTYTCYASADGALPYCVSNFMTSGSWYKSPIHRMDWDLSLSSTPIALKPNIDYIEITYHTYRCCPHDEHAMAGLGSLSDPENFQIWNFSGGFISDCGDPVHPLSISNSLPSPSPPIPPAPLTPVALYSPHNYGPTVLDLNQRIVAGPSNLTSDPNMCNTSATTRYQVELVTLNPTDRYFQMEQLFQDNPTSPVRGQLVAEIVLEPGLTLSPPVSGDEVTISNGGVTYVATYSSTFPGSVPGVAPLPGLVPTSPFSSGGTWRATFNLVDLIPSGHTGTMTYRDMKAFIDGSKFTFPITPCCPGNPDNRSPKYTVNWYINPYAGSSSTCTDCKIPIGSSHATIHLHCPGCITPGIIASDGNFERLTVGYPDHDPASGGDDGRADVSTPYSSLADLVSVYTDSKSLFMPGDVLHLSCNAHAVDGDISSLGIDYATLQSYWNSSTPHGCGTDPNDYGFTILGTGGAPPTSYPHKFNFINILVSSSCITGGTTGFNFTPVTTQEHFSIIGGSASPYDIHSYGGICAGGYFYSIPVTALTTDLPSGVTMTDRYSLDLQFCAAANGPATDCDFEFVIWYSGVPPTSAYDPDSLDGKFVSDYNLAHPSSGTTDADICAREALLKANCYYLCEGTSAQGRGYHISSDFNTQWNDVGVDPYATENTCQKICINTIKTYLTDPEGHRAPNVFPDEYRPLPLNFISDNFTAPDPAVSPFYNRSSTTEESVVTTHTSSGAESHYVVLNTVPSGSYTAGPAASWVYIPAGGDFQKSTISNLSTSPPTTSNPYFMQGDEQTEIVVTHYYDQNIPSTSCDVPNALTTVSGAGNMENITLNACSVTSPFTVPLAGTPSYPLNSPDNALLATIETAPVIYSLSGNQFQIRITNTSSTSTANNVYMLVDNLPGITYASVTANLAGCATCVPGDFTWSLDASHGLVCNLNKLHENDYVILTVTYSVNLTDCTPKTFHVFAGQNCEHAVTYANRALTTPSPCATEQSLTIAATMASVSVFGEIDNFDAPTTSCSEIDLRAHFFIRQSGEVSVLSFNLQLPSHTRLESVDLLDTLYRGGVMSYGTLGYTLTGPTSGLDAHGNPVNNYVITVSPGSLIALHASPPDLAIVNIHFKVGVCQVADFNAMIQLLTQPYCGPNILTSVSTHQTLPASAACPLPTLGAFSYTSSSCYGPTTASLLLNISGGSPDFLFKWTLIAPVPPPPAATYTTTSSTAPASSSLSSISPGTYRLVLTDHFGCTETQDYVVPPTVDPILLPTITSDPGSTCAGTATITFITNPAITTPSSYSYSWVCTNGSTTTSGPIIGTSGILSFSVAFADGYSDATISIVASNGTCYDDVSTTFYACCVPNPAPTWVNATIPHDLGALDPYHSSVTISGVTYTTLTYHPWVAGTLTLDADVSFTGERFNMDPYSKIVVPSGRTLRLDNCVLTSCSNIMWKGIELQDNTAHLIMNNTLVEDAINGVTSIGGGDYQLTNCTFNRCYRGIYVSQYAGTHTGVVQGTKFTCEASTSHLAPLPVPTKLFIPYLNGQTAEGILIDQVNNITIGALGGATLTNNFVNIKTGICVNRSPAVIQNNAFMCTDMINFPMDTGVSLYNNSSTPGLSITPYVGASASSNYNIFSNVNIGIHVLGLSSHIRGNYMSNPKYGIWVRNTFVITASHYTEEIEQNNIANLRPSEFAVGVDIDNCYGTIALVHNNNVHNALYDVKALLNQGYFSNNVATTASCNATFSHDSAYSMNIGIHSLNGWNQKIIDQNWIESIFPGLSGSARMGIFLENTGGASRVDCNTTTFYDLTNDIGIQLTNSPNNGVRNNHTNASYFGIRFWGNCSMANSLYLNTMNNHTFHIALAGGSTTTIGTQDHTGALSSSFASTNSFTEPPVPGTARFAVLGSGTTGATSRCTQSALWPLTNQIVATQSVGIFPGIAMLTLTAPIFPALTASVACTSLPTTPGPGGFRLAEELILDSLPVETDSSFTSVAEEVVANYINPDDTDVESKYEAKRHLYYNFRNHRMEYIPSAILDSFAASYHSSSAVILRNALDSIYIGNIEAASRLANSIVPVILPEQLMQQLLKDLIDSVQLDSGTVKYDNLLSIASVCPIIGGEAVYSARSILTSHFGYFHWDDDSICSPSLTLASRRANGGVFHLAPDSSGLDISVYPNPTEDLLYIWISNPEKACQVYVYDEQGKLISKQDLRIKLTKIDMKYLPQEIYCVKIQNCDGSFKTFKIQKI